MGILIFKGLIARRLCKLFGVKELKKVVAFMWILVLQTYLLEILISVRYWCSLKQSQRNFLLVSLPLFRVKLITLRNVQIVPIEVEIVECTEVLIRVGSS
jgi:hypothetical protein